MKITTFSLKFDNLYCVRIHCPASAAPTLSGLFHLPSRDGISHSWEDSVCFRRLAAADEHSCPGEERHIPETLLPYLYVYTRNTRCLSMDPIHGNRRSCPNATTREGVVLRAVEFGVRETTPKRVV